MGLNTAITLNMANRWTYCIWGFIGFAISGLECSIQSENTPSTSTVCANGQHTITCGNNTVIAITEAAYGYKGTSSGCSTATGSCCTYDNTADCLESSTTDTALMEALSGKSDGIANIADAIASTTCTSGYMSISTFNRIRYHCIPQSRIFEMCVNSSYRSGDGLPVYIQNRGYLSGTTILASDTSCSISVEVLSRSTNAQLYTLHMQLSDSSTSCQQFITVSNGNNVVKTFDCTPALFNQIQSENLTGNYFLVNFTNSKTTSGGKFWIGVKDASGNPPLVISSPAVPKIDCGVLSNPNGGSVTITDTNYGSVGNYTCATGYDVTSGNVSRTCQENATWSGNAVVCSYNCGNLDNPQNGFVSFTGSYPGHTATYGCNSDYVMDSGNIHRSCIEGSGWNGTALQCIFDCDPLTDPANGTVSFTTTTAGSQATYTCNTSFVLTGQTTRTCISGKNWSDSEPICHLGPSPVQLVPGQSKKDDIGIKLGLGLGIPLGVTLIAAGIISYFIYKEYKDKEPTTSMGTPTYRKSSGESTSDSVCQQVQIGTLKPDDHPLHNKIFPTEQLHVGERPDHPYIREHTASIHTPNRPRRLEPINFPTAPRITTEIDTRQNGTLKPDDHPLHNKIFPTQQPHVGERYNNPYIREHYARVHTPNMQSRLEPIDTRLTTHAIHTDLAPHSPTKVVNSTSEFSHHHCHDFKYHPHEAPLSHWTKQEKAHIGLKNL